MNARETKALALSRLSVVGFHRFGPHGEGDGAPHLVAAAYTGRAASGGIKKTPEPLVAKFAGLQCCVRQVQQKGDQVRVGNKG